MLHSLAILYARWTIPDSVKSSLPEMEASLSRNVHNNLDWLEFELSDGRTWLIGDDVTAADIMMGFSIDFIFTRELGTKGGRWENMEGWLERVKGREKYKKAVERTGYRL